MFPYKRLYRYNEENMEERPYKERKYYVVLKPYIKWNTDDTSSFPYCMKLEEPSSFCGKILLALRMSYMLIILVRIFKVTIYLKRNEKWGWAEIKGYGLGVIIYLIIGLNTKVHKEQSPKQ